MQEASIIISILALLGSFYSINVSKKYSRISVIHSLHELMLQKAKDCNSLFTEMLEDDNGDYTPQVAYKFYPIISEVIISIQLLDNSLFQYDQKIRRSFYLLQFWTQLQPGLRGYFKNVDPNIDYNEIGKKQLATIHDTFHLFYDDY